MIGYLFLALIPGAVPLLSGDRWFWIVLVQAPIQCALWVSVDIAWIVYGGTVLLNVGGLVVLEQAAREQARRSRVRGFARGGGGAGRRRNEGMSNGEAGRVGEFPLGPRGDVEIGVGEQHGGVLLRIA